MAEAGPDYDMLLAMVIIGDTAVGKSPIMQRYRSDEFSDVSMVTCGVDFMTRNVEVEGKTLKLQIWDTAGHPRFAALSSAYYRNKAAALLVYDVTSRRSFENIENHMRDIRTYGTNNNIVIMLVGNKSDLDDRRAVRTEEGQQLAEKHGFMFIETSAKTGSNIQEVFMQTSRAVYDKTTRGEVNASSRYGILRPTQMSHRASTNAAARSVARLAHSAAAPADDHLLLLKVTLDGDSWVGKTQFMELFCLGEFDPIGRHTLGVGFRTRTVTVCRCPIKLHIFDWYGAERYRAMAPHYHRGVAATLLLYDVTDRKTFYLLPSRLREIYQYRTGSHSVIMLVGNKTDLTALRQVSYQEGEQFAKENGLMFIEASARERRNVYEAFMRPVEAVFDKILAGELDISSVPDATSDRLIIQVPHGVGLQQLRSPSSQVDQNPSEDPQAAPAPAPLSRNARRQLTKLVRLAAYKDRVELQRTDLRRKLAAEAAQLTDIVHTTKQIRARAACSLRDRLRNAQAELERAQLLLEANTAV